MGIVSIVGLITLQIAPIDLWLGRIRPNLLFGPLDAEGAISGLTLTFSQTLVVLAIALACFRLARSRNQTTTNWAASRLLPISIVLLTALDVAVANRWMLAEVNPAVFETPTEVGKQLAQLKSEYPQTLPRIYRSFNVQARNQTWPQETSPSRLEEIVTWQRETLFPKQHFEHEVALLGSFGSVWPSHYRYLTNSLGAEHAEKGYLLNPAPTRYRLAGQMANERTTDSLSLKPETLLAKGVEFLPKRNRFTDLRLSLAGPWPIASQLNGTTTIKSVKYSTRSITAETRTEQDLQLQVCVLHDEGWQAKLEPTDGSPATELKITPSTDQIGMRVDLPSGNHIVTFTYSPREFWIGCWISGIGWLVLVTVFLVTRNNSFRRSAKTKSI